MLITINLLWFIFILIKFTFFINTESFKRYKGNFEIPVPQFLILVFLVHQIKIFNRCYLRIIIIRTFLANITTINIWYKFLLGANYYYHFFYCKIRNTLTCIQYFRWYQCLSWASFKAISAITTFIFNGFLMHLEVLLVKWKYELWIQSYHIFHLSIKYFYL